MAAPNKNPNSSFLFLKAVVHIPMDIPKRLALAITSISDTYLSNWPYI